MDTSSTSPPANHIEQLPDDVLLHIFSFLPTLADKCRTSIFSRRWRYLWRHTSHLDFDPFTLLVPGDPNSDDRMYDNPTWYISWVNTVIDSMAAEMPLVKHLLIRYPDLKQDHQHHINKWINFAISNCLETLHLDFSYVSSRKQFILSENLWYTAPSGLSSVKCLKSLFVSSISVSKQFVDFILSNCPLLEELSLTNPGTFTHLDVSGVPPLRLKRLKLCMYQDFELNTLCAPYLTSFYYTSSKFSPQVIHVPLLTDLSIGGPYRSPPINVHLEPFRSYFPQLKKLELKMMSRVQDFKFSQLPELVTLRYLKMEVSWNLDLIFFQVIKFIKACPLLETFVLTTEYGFRRRSPVPLEPEQVKNKQKWYRELEEKCVFESLKELELYGANEITIEFKVIECIIIKSHKLETLTLDTRLPYMLRPVPESGQVVKTKAQLWCQGKLPQVHINVIN